MSCKRCGRCCEVIQLRFSHEQISSGEILPEFPNDFEFILKYWVPITPIEAWHLQPDRTIWWDRHYYRCTQYDRFSHMCKAQKFKPPVCEDYPWYHKTPDYLEFEGCGFQADLGKGAL